MENSSKDIFKKILSEDASAMKKIGKLHQQISQIHSDHHAQFSKDAKSALKAHGFTSLKDGKSSHIFQKVDDDSDVIHTARIDKHSPALSYTNSSGRSHYHHHGFEDTKDGLSKKLTKMIHSGGLYESVDEAAKKIVQGEDESDEDFRRRMGMAQMSISEEEQLDELSKKTLGSYVKKAADDMANHGAQFGKNYDKDALKGAMKRKIGISKAIGKLTKEDVETLEEKKMKSSDDYKDEWGNKDKKDDRKKAFKNHLKNARNKKYNSRED